MRRRTWALARVNLIRFNHLTGVLTAFYESKDMDGCDPNQFTARAESDFGMRQVADSTRKCSFGKKLYRDDYDRLRKHWIEPDLS